MRSTIYDFSNVPYKSIFAISLRASNSDEAIARAVVSLYEDNSNMVLSTFGVDNTKKAFEMYLNLNYDSFRYNKAVDSSL